MTKADQCTWVPKLGKETCNKPKWKGGDFCLFHKPKKNKDESLLFYEVINMDYLKFLPKKELAFLNFQLAFDSEACKKYPELLRIISTGITPMPLSFNDSIEFGKALVEARNLYLSQFKDPTIGKIALSLHDQSLLYGNESVFFIGYIFPNFPSKFNYRINKSGMGNGRGFSFSECIFEGYANFEDYDFKSYSVEFNSCKFEREISFSNSKFEGVVVFKNCNLNTGYTFIGKNTFDKAIFSGELLHFKSGSLCTLYGIKLSEYTDLIIEEDVVVPDHDRMIGYTSFFKRISDEVFTIAKRQAERTGNISLLQKYEENLSRFRFNYPLFLNDLVEIGAALQKRLHSTLLEDIYNDYYKDALTFKGYHVRDQTRGGSSASGKTAGEIDIEVCNSFGIPFSIIEAFRLSSFSEKTIVSHVNKLLHRYDTSGHEKNIILVYCESEKFDDLFSKYESFIAKELNSNSEFEKKHLFESLIEMATGKTDIRVLECIHSREGKKVSVIHVLIKAQSKKGA